jgi:hypothetical protein
MFMRNRDVFQYFGKMVADTLLVKHNLRSSKAVSLLKVWVPQKPWRTYKFLRVDGEA